MTPYLCDLAIEFDAQVSYEAKDIENLIKQTKIALSESSKTKVVVILKNAHYLTTKAFSVLYNYIRESNSSLMLILVSCEKAKIFPPLLDYVQTA
ncbi:hypothetical protein [Nostoc sp. WHI]|uniref:hypothetical protein n=1 Tax=Nostoc sp. WHI TaxID=2650611 RepID=UPI0018C706C8|nr:hypothetical protein [Nostoc sp. WHI]MBG1269429.1 hypothetical protein [Nostoc sp. WHI]